MKLINQLKQFGAFKRFLVWSIFAVISYLFQSNILQYIALAGVVPNLFIILIVSISYMRGQNEAMAVAVVCGLLVDCTYGDVIGLYTLFYLIIAFLNGFFHLIYYDEDYTIPLILIGVSDFLFNFLCYLSDFLLRNRLHFFYYLKNIILPELVYTVLVSIVVYKLLHSINGFMNKFLAEEV